MSVTIKATESELYIKKTNKFLEKFGMETEKHHFYILSFIHKSIVNERADLAPEHNERLEFLGDAVLELCVTQRLYEDFPEKPEGLLTDIRSTVVRGSNLATIGREIGIQEMLLLGNGEEAGGGRENDYLIANSVEAFVGALYLDKGLEGARQFVENFIYTSLERILSKKSIKDGKTSIQEYCQGRYDITPHYEVLSESGPDHNKSFEVGVYLGEKLMGIGIGSSKKKGEEASAQNAWKNRYKWDYKRPPKKES